MPECEKEHLLKAHGRADQPKLPQPWILPWYFMCLHLICSVNCLQHLGGLVNKLIIFQRLSWVHPRMWCDCMFPLTLRESLIVWKHSQYCPSNEWLITHKNTKQLANSNVASKYIKASLIGWQHVQSSEWTVLWYVTYFSRGVKHRKCWYYNMTYSRLFAKGPHLLQCSEQ